MENKSFEKEEEGEEMGQEGDAEEEFNIILDKKLLETITENQNSPYSTQVCTVLLWCPTYAVLHQASHNCSRRMSAQSLFGEPTRQSSVVKEPGFEGPVLEQLELYHESEYSGEEEGGVGAGRAGNSQTGAGQSSGHSRRRKLESMQ